MKNTAKYLIIGASAAGISAARTIRQHDKSGEITVVTEENYKPYGRPLISYVLKGKVKLENTGYVSDDFFEKNNINFISGKKAVSVDASSKCVKLCDDSSLNYDKLLIAAGSVPFVPPVENAEGKPNVYTFLNMASAEALKEKVTPDMDAVVIGGGLIGMKAAEGLIATCKSVTVLELSDRILPTILDKTAGEMMSEHVLESGIVCRTGDTAVKANGNKRVKSLVLKSGDEIPCDVLVMAVGVRPNVELAESAGCELNRGILVDNTMKTSVDDIYAAGDCVVSHNVLDGSDRIIALWPNAVEQGKVAGAAMAGSSVPYEGGYAMNAIDLFGLHVLTAGVMGTEEDGYDVSITCDGENYRRFCVKDGVLKGYMLIGDISRGGVYTTLIRDAIPLDSLDGEYESSPEYLLIPKNIRDDMIYGRASK